MSKYFNSLKMLYTKGYIDKADLQQAVKDGKITSSEYKKITGEEYVA